MVMWHCTGLTYEGVGGGLMREGVANVMILSSIRDQHTPVPRSKMM